MTCDQADLDSLPCLVGFDAAGMVLTAFGRCPTGTVPGDQALAERFLNLFYRV